MTPQSKPKTREEWSDDIHNLAVLQENDFCEYLKERSIVLDAIMSLQGEVERLRDVLHGIIRCYDAQSKGGIAEFSTPPNKFWSTMGKEIEKARQAK